jgi:hypothetical protein
MVTKRPRRMDRQTDGRHSNGYLKAQLTLSAELKTYYLQDHILLKLHQTEQFMKFQ